MRFMSGHHIFLKRPHHRVESNKGILNVCHYKTNCLCFKNSTVYLGKLNKYFFAQVHLFDDNKNIRNNGRQRTFNSNNNMNIPSTTTTTTTTATTSSTTRSSSTSRTVNPRLMTRSRSSSIRKSSTNSTSSNSSVSSQVMDCFEIIHHSLFIVFHRSLFKLLFFC